MSTMLETLATLDKVLGVKTPKVVKMTKADYDKHVAAELKKAKDESEEEDKKAGAEKAKKRLEFLRATTKLAIAKGSWDTTGQTNPINIPVYEFGFEPPTELPTETQVATPPAIGGTAGDGQSFAAAGGQTGFDPSGAAKTSNGTQVPASGAGTQGDTSFAAGGGAQGFGDSGVAKALGQLTETLKSLSAPEAPPAQQAAPQGDPNAHVDDPSVWPSDMANPAFVKEGVAKRAEEWGTDPWAPTK